jgi:1-acyl-sn-glycerol-3-phosphate acyltransferase
MSFVNLIVYGICSWSSAIIFSVFFGLRVVGVHRLPKRGGVLLVANHKSFLDPVCIGCGRPRHFHYLARKTLFADRLFGWLLRRLNCVPIDQEGIGIEGIRNIIARLEAGHPVLVFPEGERTHDGKMQPLKAGIALLFKRVKVPIMPVGIAGTYDAWPRWRKYPIPSPIFLPPNGRAIAVAYGRLRDAADLLRLPRDEMLALLTNDIAALIEQAEAIRRK